MRNLDYYLMQDHAARRHTMVIAIIGGAAIGVAAQLLGASVGRAALMCAATACVIEITRAFRYKQASRKSQGLTVILPVRRRYLLRAALSAASFVILSLFRFPSIEAGVVERKLQQASDNPFDPQNAKVARRILAAARAGLVKIDTRIVKDTGVKFIQTAELNPTAWSAVQEYLTYRSFLNADFAPELTPAPALTPATGKSKYRPTVTITALRDVGHQPRIAYQVFLAGGYASGDKSARLELLSNPQPEGSEVAYFILDGGNATIGLDGAYMKNVIIRHCDISYAGGPVRLENVWFVNCTFHAYARVVPETKELGKVILAYAPVSYPFS